MQTILFLHDTSLATPRGAELTIKELMAVGKERGYVITLDNLSDIDKTRNQIRTADLVVLNSCSRCHYEKELLQWLISEKTPYVKVEYDYNFCIRRNILCTVDPKVRSCCDPDKFHLYRTLFAGAVLNVFQSPKHYKAHFEFYGEAVARKLIMPPTVNIAQLKPSKKRDADTIPFFGDLNYLKGGHEYVSFAEAHPGKSFPVYGMNRLRREIPANITFNDPISNEEVLEVLGRTKTLFCKPVWPEPSGRLVAEAFLSGCEILGNDRIGTFSFNFYPDDPEKAVEEIEAAPANFWNSITDFLNNESKTITAPKLKKVLVYKSYGGLGDIFFAVPAVYKLAEVSESLALAVAPRLVEFFSKYLDVKVISETVARASEDDYTHIYELGNYPAFRGYDLPHALKYPTHRKVKQHAIQHYIDTIAKLHPDIDNHLAGYPYFKHQPLESDPYFVVHHGAGFLLKIWPTDKYANLIRTLLKQFPKLNCSIIQGPEDPDIAQYLNEESDRITYITGGMTDVGMVMENALFHVGNDAGITHVAGAFDVPTVGIYGPTGPGSWGSFASHNELIWGKQGVCNIRCNYDVILNCEHRICLNSVTVDRVLEALYKVLARAYQAKAEKIVVNPRAQFDYSETDVLVTLGEGELLLEYHNPAMKEQIENLFKKGELPANISPEFKTVVDVLKQQQLLFLIPTFDHQDPE